MQPPSIKKYLARASDWQCLAAIIWSGNFIIARGVIRQIPPVSLNFYRWLIASIIISPFAIRQFKNEWMTVRAIPALFVLGCTHGHCPVQYVCLCRRALYDGDQPRADRHHFFSRHVDHPCPDLFKGKDRLLKMSGILICICWDSFSFVKRRSSKSIDPCNLRRVMDGCCWLPFSLPVYNTLVKKKPANISAINFLFIVFSLGTILSDYLSIYGN